MHEQNKFKIYENLRDALDLPLNIKRVISKLMHAALLQLFGASKNLLKKFYIVARFFLYSYVQ